MNFIGAFLAVACVIAGIALNVLGIVLIPPDFLPHIPETSIITRYLILATAYIPYVTCILATLGAICGLGNPKMGSAYLVTAGFLYFFNSGSLYLLSMVVGNGALLQIGLGDLIVGGGVILIWPAILFLLASWIFSTTTPSQKPQRG